MAVAGPSTGTVSILLGNGDGTFQPHVDYGTGNVPVWVTTGDFNGDGKLDLAIPDFAVDTGKVVSILLRKGDGTFVTHVDYATGFGSGSVAAGDFNRDGGLDLAVTNGATVSPFC